MTDTPEFAKIRALAQADRRVGACDTQEIARIRAALAAGPTPGPWGWSHASLWGADLEIHHEKKSCAECGHEAWECGPAVLSCATESLCRDVVELHEDTETWEANQADKEHIAACNPTAMTALLAHIDVQAAEVDRLGRLIKAVQNTDAAAQQPVLIRNGLSKETIEALKTDFRRSYEDAVAFKPKEAK